MTPKPNWLIERSGVRMEQRHTGVYIVTELASAEFKAVVLYQGQSREKAEAMFNAHTRVAKVKSH